MFNSLTSLHTRKCNICDSVTTIHWRQQLVIGGDIWNALVGSVPVNNSDLTRLAQSNSLMKSETLSELL